LPDPAKGTSDDEIGLLEVLKEVIPKDPKRWRKVIEEMHGVSEETTTGVHRLY